MITQTRESLGGIFTFLRYFVLGETGFVRQRSGFAAAWVVGLLVVGAVILGAPQEAEAFVCNTWGDDTCSPGVHGPCVTHCDDDKGCPDGICLDRGLYHMCWCCWPAPCGMK